MSDERQYRRCPFCGDIEPEIILEGTDMKAMICMVKCSMCGARGPRTVQDPRGAGDQWDRRIEDTPDKRPAKVHFVMSYGDGPVIEEAYDSNIVPGWLSNLCTRCGDYLTNLPAVVAVDSVAGNQFFHCECWKAAKDEAAEMLKVRSDGVSTGGE